MKTFKFKTTIRNEEEISLIKNSLNNSEKIIDWKLSDNNGSKILTIRTNELRKDEISRKIFEAGFRNIPLNSIWEKIFFRLTKKDCCNRLNQ